MENKTNSVTLEEVIKNSLVNYEARYDANDWAHMESMLGTTPTSSSFSWKPAFTVMIVLLLLGGGYIIFTTLNFNKIAEKPIPLEKPPVKTKKPTQENPAKTIVIPPAQPTPAPVTEEPKQPVKQEIPVVTKTENKPEKEVARSQEDKATEEGKAEKAAQRKKEREELTKKEEREAKRARKKAVADSLKNIGVAEKETEKKTDEKEPEKKVKAKTSTGIGWNIFSTINADSLKKYRERVKKDSVK